MATFESATATFDVCTLSPKRELIADAAGALALVETMPAALRGVKLGNKSYTAAAAAALAGRLKGLRGLVDVDIADKGLDALLPLFGGTPLVSLKTCNNGMSEAAAKQLAGLLTDGGDTALERFHYHNNMSGDNGAVAVASIVAASPKLVDLRFSGTRAGRAGRRAPALAKLELNGNALDDAALEKLGELLGDRDILGDMDDNDGTRRRLRLTTAALRPRRAGAPASRAPRAKFVIKDGAAAGGARPDSARQLAAAPIPGDAGRAASLRRDIARLETLAAAAEADDAAR
ncbi:hypothetical protein JL721_7013 [Aureococcus anophagefferens]|nr:hypothetical protein JL721_7013 [Aureococcus anophagefferens]